MQYLQQNSVVQTLSLTVLLLFFVLFVRSFFRGPKLGIQSAPAKVSGTTYPYGLSESIGRRASMEDRNVVIVLKNKGKDEPFVSTLFGLFDGHAGSAAAVFCSSRIGSVLMNDSAWPHSPPEALVNAFHLLDESFLKLARLHSPPLNDGTTAVVVLTLGSRILVANAGDSRAVLIQRSGRALPLSEDHKPNRPDEIARIKALGGGVYFHGVWRVGGVLAVSRAIGDRPLKPFISSTPEIREWEVGADDAALVIACDGLWDVLSNEQVADVTLSAMVALPQGEKTHDPGQRASSALVRQAIISGSMDNVSVIVVDLRSSSKTDYY